MAKKKRKKSNPYHRFVKAHRGQGLTQKQLASLYRSSKKKVKSKSKKRGGGRRYSRTLPKELLDLAAALRAASAKPTEAKASAIERRMESLIRQIRAEQRNAASKARAEREAEEIRAQAKTWAASGPSGDPGRRRRRTRKSRKHGKRRARR